MPSNKTSFRDETDYLHFSPGATGLHHLHSHRTAAPTEHSSGALALDLPSVRAGASRSTKTDSAARTHLHGILLLLTVAALWGSYSPVLKFLFSQPHPPSAALMTAAQALLAAAFLLACSLGGSSRTTSAKREGKASGGAAAQSGRFRPAASGKNRLHARLGLALTRIASRLRSALPGGAGSTWQGLNAGVVRQGKEGSYILPKQQPLHSVPSVGGNGDRGSDAGSGETGRAGEQTQEQQQVMDALSRGGSEGLHGNAIHSSSGMCGSGAIVEDGFPEISSGGGGGSVTFFNNKQTQDDGLLLTSPRSSTVPALQLTMSGTAAVTSLGAPPDAAEVGGPTGAGRGSRSSNFLTVPLSSLAAVGLELGTYSFCAAALGAWGVQRISATKVAFLGQASSLMTPLLVALSGQRVALVVWGACCFGVLGAALVALDGSSRLTAAAASDSAGSGLGAAGGTGLEGLVPTHVAAAAAASVGGAAGSGGGGAHVGVSRAMRLESGGADGGGLLSSAAVHHTQVLGWMRHTLPPALSRESQGAHYVLASCLFYALGTVRLGVHGGHFASLDLAAASAVGYAALSLVWLLAEMLGTPSGSSSYFAVLTLLLGDNVTLALVLWAGFGPGALSSYLQVLGQRIVPAAQAQMLYSSAPFWSALIAQILLQGRDGVMGPLAWLGGGVMLSASLIASLLDSYRARESRSKMGSSVPSTGPLAVAAMAGLGGGGAPVAVSTSASASASNPSSRNNRWWGGGAGLHHQYELDHNDIRNRDL